MNIQDLGRRPDPLAPAGWPPNLERGDKAIETPISQEKNLSAFSKIFHSRLGSDRKAPYPKTE